MTNNMDYDSQKPEEQGSTAEDFIKTKKCLVHDVEMDYRTKDGKHWYSHSADLVKYGLTWCNGYGWKNPDPMGSRYLPEPQLINEGFESPKDQLESEL